MSDDMAEALAFAMAMADSPGQIEMAVRLGQSLELTDGWWELVPLVVEAGERRDRMPAANMADSIPAGRRLTASVRMRLEAAASEWQEDAHRALEEHTLDESAISGLSQAEIAADPYSVMALLVDMKSATRMLLPAVESAPVASIDELVYYLSYLRALGRPRQTPLLLRAILVAAIGAVEPLVSRLVHRALHHRDPQAFPSLASPALDRRTRELCFGSPRRWRGALVDELGLMKLSVAVDWERLDQFWEDRNVIIHRGSVIDARHSSTSGIEVGAVLEFTPEEVRSVIDEIGAIRYALVAGVWDFIAPGVGAKIASDTWPTVWESLRAGRWRQAEGLSRFHEAYAGDNESAAAARVNRWLARERGLGAEAIQADVESWDPSPLPANFQLARMILLKQDDSAVQFLEALLENGSLLHSALREWPLFDRLRDAGRLVHLM